MRNIKNFNKHRFLAPKSAPGFTLIEMIVVVGIIALISGLFLANYNGIRGGRDLKISQNQLITDIRKVQSYTLSSRNVAGSGNPANYYVIKFSLSNPGGYTIGAIDNQNRYSDVQTVKFPKGIVLSTLSVKLPTETSYRNALCVDTAFSLPFGRVFMDYVANKSDDEIDKSGGDLKDEDNSGGDLNGEDNGDVKEGDLKNGEVYGFNFGGQKDTAKVCDMAGKIASAGDLSIYRNRLLNISLLDTSNANSTPVVIGLNGISQAIELQTTGSGGSGGGGGGTGGGF